MAKKTSKAKSKKSATPVDDLNASKDPKGGAQKREGPDMNSTTRPRSPQGASKPRLS